MDIQTRSGRVGCADNGNLAVGMAGADPFCWYLVKRWGGQADLLRFDYFYLLLVLSSFSFEDIGASLGLGETLWTAVMNLTRPLPVYIARMASLFEQTYHRFIFLAFSCLVNWASQWELERMEWQYSIGLRSGANTFQAKVLFRLVFLNQEQTLWGHQWNPGLFDWLFSSSRRELQLESYCSY